MPDEQVRKDVETIRNETVEGLEENRIASDRRLAERSSETQKLALDLSDRTASREREAAGLREELAAQLAYERGAEAARIDVRLSYLDEAVKRINGSIEKTGGALIDLRDDMQERFDNQIKLAITTKAESRRLILQVFSAILVATISAAAVIIVALINTGSGT